MTFQQKIFAHMADRARSALERAVAQGDAQMAQEAREMITFATSGGLQDTPQHRALWSRVNHFAEFGRP